MVEELTGVIGLVSAAMIQTRDGDDANCFVVGSGDPSNVHAYKGLS